MRRFLGIATLTATLAAPTSAAAACRGAVPWQNAASVLGKVATLKGPVAGTKYASTSNGSPTFLDLGRPYPNEGVSVVIWIENRAAFGRPEVKYRGHTICVRGLVTSYGGVAEIEARSPSQITIVR